MRCFYIGYTYNMRVTFVIFIVSECKARWKALRERFAKEVKKEKNDKWARSSSVHTMGAFEPHEIYPGVH